MRGESFSIFAFDQEDIRLWGVMPGLNMEPFMIVSIQNIDDNDDASAWNF